METPKTAGPSTSTTVMSTQTLYLKPPPLPHPVRAPIPHPVHFLRVASSPHPFTTQAAQRCREQLESRATYSCQYGETNSSTRILVHCFGTNFEDRPLRILITGVHTNFHPLVHPPAVTVTVTLTPILITSSPSHIPSIPTH